MLSSSNSVGTRSSTAALATTCPGGRLLHQSSCEVDGVAHDRERPPAGRAEVAHVDRTAVEADPNRQADVDLDEFAGCSDRGVLVLSGRPRCAGGEDDLAASRVDVARQPVHAVAGRGGISPLWQAPGAVRGPRRVRSDSRSASTPPKNTKPTVTVRCSATMPAAVCSTSQSGTNGSTGPSTGRGRRPLVHRRASLEDPALVGRARRGRRRRAGLPHRG